MEPLNILIKPVSGSCQMQCSYCFYKDEGKCREILNYGLMSRSTTKNIIEKTLIASKGMCTFSFQGGEPTLAGLPYFSYFVETVKKCNKRNDKVMYAIQTNGYALDEEWAKFLRDNKFLVGVSLDGPPDIHDHFRKGPLGEPTHALVLSNIRLLQSYNIPVNILCVVTGLLARCGVETYTYFKKNGFDYIQFIPCLDNLEIENTQDQATFLDPVSYGKFLIEVFEVWYKDLRAGSQISIRWYDELLYKLAGLGEPYCQLQGKCTKQYVVEADGQFYPCDFYVLDDWKLGNINEVSFKTIDKMRLANCFIADSRLKSEACRNCKWMNLCGGGCRRDRQGALGAPLLDNRYCVSFKMFFEKEIGKLMELANIIRQQEN